MVGGNQPSVGRDILTTGEQIDTSDLANAGTRKWRETVSVEECQMKVFVALKQSEVPFSFAAANINGSDRTWHC